MANRVPSGVLLKASVSRARTSGLAASGEAGLSSAFSMETTARDKVAVTPASEVLSRRGSLAGGPRYRPVPQSSY